MHPPSLRSIPWAVCPEIHWNFSTNQRPGNCQNSDIKIQLLKLPLFCSKTNFQQIFFMTQWINQPERIINWFNWVSDFQLQRLCLNCVWKMKESVMREAATWAVWYKTKFGSQNFGYQIWCLFCYIYNVLKNMFNMSQMMMWFMWSTVTTKNWQGLFPYDANNLITWHISRLKTSLNSGASRDFGLTTCT